MHVNNITFLKVIQPNNLNIFTSKLIKILLSSNFTMPIYLSRI